MIRCDCPALAGPALPALVALLWLVGAVPAAAATLDDVPCCQRLDDGQRARAAALMAEQFPYDGCDDTVASCLALAEPHPLVRRLAGEICRRVGRGQDDGTIATALTLRARSMMPGAPRADIDLDGVPRLGADDAPVVLVEYAGGRCPFCSKITPELMAAVGPGGRLDGKVRLYFKLFPIKGHEGSAESGLAAVAAAQQGRFWAFLELAYARFDRFSVEALPGWAAESGLDADAYASAVADGAVRDRLIASKKEGITLGVDATPTFFIDGRRYHAELAADQLLDVLEEAYERAVEAR